MIFPMLSSFTSTLELPSKERYDCFIQSVRQSKTVWGIGDEYESVTCKDSDNKSSIPVWPAKELAELFIDSGWEKYRAKEVSLITFYDWLYTLEVEDIYLTVFPNIRFDAWVVPAKKLLDDLQKSVAY